MICERCHGERFIQVHGGGDRAPLIEPCPDCGGCGLEHCCEGERPGNIGEVKRSAPTFLFSSKGDSRTSKTTTVPLLISGDGRRADSAPR